jgi:hypothetical protein
VPAAASAAASLADGVARSTAASPTPVARVDTVPTTNDLVGRTTVLPQLFLGLAVLCAIAAFVAHRRLHRA